MALASLGSPFTVLKKQLADLWGVLIIQTRGREHRGNEYPSILNLEAGHLAELMQFLASLFRFSLAVAAAALAWSRAARSDLPVSGSVGEAEDDLLCSSSAGMLRAPRFGVRQPRSFPLPCCREVA